MPAPRACSPESSRSCCDTRHLHLRIPGRGTTRECLCAPWLLTVFRRRFCWPQPGLRPVADESRKLALCRELTLSCNLWLVAAQEAVSRRPERATVRQVGEAGAHSQLRVDLCSHRQGGGPPVLDGLEISSCDREPSTPADTCGGVERENGTPQDGMPVATTSCVASALKSVEHVWSAGHARVPRRLLRRRPCLPWRVQETADPHCRARPHGVTRTSAVATRTLHVSIARHGAF